MGWQLGTKVINSSTSLSTDNLSSLLWLRCYQTRVWLLDIWKAAYERGRKLLVESKVAFNQNAGIWGWWTQVLYNHLWRFHSAMKVYKRKQASDPINHWDGGQSPSSPTVCYLVHTRLLKGKLQKTFGHLLNTYSSVLLLWSTERTNKIGKGIVCSKDFERCLTEMSRAWGPWFNVSDKRASSES